LPYGDVFNYQVGDEETVKTIIHRVHSDLNTLSAKIKEKIVSGEFPDIKYSCILREGRFVNEPPKKRLVVFD